MGKCDEQVEILKELEQSMISSEQSNSDNEEEFCEVQTELIVAFDKVKIWNEEHKATSFNLEKMCNFIEESESTMESKNIKEAHSLLEQNVKHEKETDACVSKWRRQNAKWLRKRKRVKKAEAPIVEEREEGCRIGILVEQK